MLKAKNIMTGKVLSVRPESDILTAARLMLQHHYNGLPVVDEKNRILGIICQSDLMVQQERIPVPSFFSILGGVVPLAWPANMDAEVKKIAALKVQDAMTPHPVTVSPDASLEEIATIMVRNKIHTVPVQDGGILVGIIGKEDILRTLLPESS